MALREVKLVQTTRPFEYASPYPGEEHTLLVCVADTSVTDAERAKVSTEIIAAKGEQLLECYDTVENYVATHGGERILGWCFFDWPRVLLMAELHAVWKRPDGSFLDIAPHQAK